MITHVIGTAKELDYVFDTIARKYWLIRSWMQDGDITPISEFETKGLDLVLVGNRLLIKYSNQINYEVYIIG